MYNNNYCYRDWSVITYVVHIYAYFLRAKNLLEFIFRTKILIYDFQKNNIDRRSNPLLFGKSDPFQKR